MKEQSPPKKLTRSRSDRYVGGVAAGIAARLNIDPIFVRIGFVVSLVLGGLGLIAYFVLLATMPVEGDSSEPLPPIEPRRRNTMIALAVAVGIVAVSTAGSGGFASWLFGFWPGTVFGILFWVAAGAGATWLLLNGAFRNRSKETPEQTARPSAPTGSESQPGEATTEIVTYADSPSQLTRTEIMQTRELNPGGTSRTEPHSTVSEKDENQRDETPKDRAPSMIGRFMVWFAIGVAGLIVFSTLFVVSAGTTALFGGIPMATLVILLGGGMVFATLRGRRQLSLWLLTAAVAVTLPMAAVSIADLRVEGNYGDINETPLSVVDVPRDGYKMAAGNMTIDLRKFDFDGEKTLDLPVNGGMGLTSVIVPDRVCVTGEVTGKAGVISFRGRDSNGIDVSQEGARLDPESDGRRLANPVVRLDGEFKLGAFEVVDNTQWRRFGQANSFDAENNRGNTASRTIDTRRATAACSAFTQPKREQRS